MLFQEDLNETWIRIDKTWSLQRSMFRNMWKSGHGYMPIVIEALSETEFASWVNEAKNEFAKLNSRTIASVKIGE